MLMHQERVCPISVQRQIITWGLANNTQSYLCSSRDKMPFKLPWKPTVPRQCFRLSFQRNSFNKRSMSWIKIGLWKRVAFYLSEGKIPPAVRVHQSCSPNCTMAKMGPDLSLLRLCVEVAIFSLLFWYRSGLVAHTWLRKPPWILPTWCSSQEFLSHEVMKTKLELCPHPSLWG